MLGDLLITFVVVIGILVMVGGSSTGMKAAKEPFAFASKLIKDLLRGIYRLLRKYLPKLGRRIYRRIRHRQGHNPRSANRPSSPSPRRGRPRRR